MQNSTKKNYILIGFIVIKFALQYILVSPEYGLHRDEFLHLDQGHHLAWGYLSVPPFTSWLSYLIYKLGNTLFWIRFFPALFGALTLFIVWKTIEALNGGIFALILGTTALLFSVLLRLNILYQPNSMDVLAWATCSYLLLRYIQTRQNTWLYGMALAFALGFLNKYNIIFLIIGLVPALLLTKQRAVFTKPIFYLALLLAILLIAPNLLWQYQNHFPVFHHLQELQETQLVNVNRFDFLKEQVLYFTGSFLIILAGLYALLFYPPYQKYRFFFWSFGFTFILFVYLKAKAYYAIGLYPIYIAFGSAYLGEALKKINWATYLQPVLIAIPILCFIPVYRVAFPNKSPEYIIKHAENYRNLGMLRWEDGKDHILPQDFADMLGWKELAHKVDSIYAQLSDPKHTLIFCDNYGQAGAINYYAKKVPHNAVSFNADYIHWFDFNQPHYHLIRVINYSDVQAEIHDISPYFEHTQISGMVSNVYAREHGTTIVCFQNAKIDVNAHIKEEIKDLAF